MCSTPLASVQVPPRTLRASAPQGLCSRLLNSRMSSFPWPWASIRLDFLRSAGLSRTRFRETVLEEVFLLEGHAIDPGLVPLNIRRALVSLLLGQVAHPSFSTHISSSSGLHFHGNPRTSSRPNAPTAMSTHTPHNCCPTNPSVSASGRLAGSLVLPEEVAVPHLSPTVCPATGPS